MAARLKVAETTPVIQPRIIRDAGFAQRFEMACDSHAHCPPLHQGRLRWIVDQFAERFGETITTETARKWRFGEAKPRQDKNALLAQILEVDPTWLYMGIDPELEPKERKARNAMADGVVNVVAGIIQMDGGNPAFPDEDDDRATKENVDLYAIIKGAQYAFHVCMADGDGNFAVPTRHSAVTVLGVTRKGMAFEIVELPAEVIAAGRKRGGSIEVSQKGRKITSFARRLNL